MVHCGNNGSFYQLACCQPYGTGGSHFYVAATQAEMAGSFTVFLAFLIGYAKIYVGVHYPTDVLGGSCSDSC